MVGARSVAEFISGRVRRISHMDSSIITALAALAGAVIGGFTSFVSSWWTQRAQARAQWGVQIQIRRQDLYKEFIADASKLFIHALQNNIDKADVFALMALYADVSRMRVLSTTHVVESADQIVKAIIAKVRRAEQESSPTSGNGAQRANRPTTQLQ